MGVYLVDRDLPGITGEGLAALQRAEITASQQLTAAGQAVRYLRSVFIPGEARCMCLFEAEDEAAVAAVNRGGAAAVHADRRGAGSDPVTAEPRLLPPTAIGPPAPSHRDEFSRDRTKGPYHVSHRKHDAARHRRKEPMFEVAQLAHVELFTPKPDETLRFFTELFGLQETEREGQSVYLRAYEDFYHHTLKVTEAPKPGLGHVAWRTTSPQALERRVAAIETSGLGVGWSEGDRGPWPSLSLQPRPPGIQWNCSGMSRTTRRRWRSRVRCSTAHRSGRSEACRCGDSTTST